MLGLYYSAPESPLNEPIVALNGEQSGMVCNVCVPSDVSPHYAPNGRALVSVSVLDAEASEGVELQVLDELRQWFGPQVDSWEHLRTYAIPHGLPRPTPASQYPAHAIKQVNETTWVAGDHIANASIDGAMHSGQQAAEAILSHLNETSTVHPT